MSKVGSAILEIGGGAGGFAALVYPVVGRITKRRQAQAALLLEQAVRNGVTAAVAEIKDSLDETTKKVHGLEIQLAAEFGGNHGGLRQKVDEFGGILSQHLKDSDRQIRQIHQRIDAKADKANS